MDEVKKSEVRMEVTFYRPRRRKGRRARTRQGTAAWPVPPKDAHLCDRTSRTAGSSKPDCSGCGIWPPVKSKGNSMKRAGELLFMMEIKNYPPEKVLEAMNIVEAAMRWHYE